MMYGELKKVRLVWEYAQVILGKTMETRLEYEWTMPPTDAREQANLDWYHEPEELENPDTGLIELQKALDEGRQLLMKRPLERE